jgi:hypothetical protein
MQKTSKNESVLESIVYSETYHEALNMLITTATLKVAASYSQSLISPVCYTTVDVGELVKDHLRQKIAEQLFEPIKKAVKDLMDEVHGEMRGMIKTFSGHDIAYYHDPSTRMFLDVMYRKLGEIMDMLC